MTQYFPVLLYHASGPRRTLRRAWGGRGSGRNGWGCLRIRSNRRIRQRRYDWLFRARSSILRTWHDHQERGRSEATERRCTTFRKMRSGKQALQATSRFSMPTAASPAMEFVTSSAAAESWEVPQLPSPLTVGLEQPRSRSEAVVVRATSWFSMATVASLVMDRTHNILWVVPSPGKLRDFRRL